MNVNAEDRCDRPITRGARHTRRRRRDARGGYLYVAVLFTALIVAGAVATALSLDTTRIKTHGAATDRRFDWPSRNCIGSRSSSPPMPIGERT